MMIPKSVKDYKEFFFGEVMKTKGREIPHPYLEYMTDDVKDQCYYGTRPTPLSNDFREAMWAYYTWQANPEVGMSNEFSTDVAWSSYYHKILMTNIILDQLPEMNGTDMERRDLAGEAYFMRALSYFMLANLYGQPYHPATAGQDLCVPVNDEVSLSDRMMKRATNAVVYAKWKEMSNAPSNALKLWEERRVFFVRTCPQLICWHRVSLFFRRSMTKRFCIATLF